MKKDTFRLTLRFGFGNLLVNPSTIDGVAAGCISVYDPHKTLAPIGGFINVDKEELNTFDELLTLEFYKEESIDVWIRALEETRKILRGKKNEPTI